MSDEEMQEHYDNFFEDVFVECEDKYGEIEEMNVCDNLGDHLVGNVYIKVKFINNFNLFKCIFLFRIYSSAAKRMPKKAPRTSTTDGSVDGRSTPSCLRSRISVRHVVASTKWANVHDLGSATLCT